MSWGSNLAEQVSEEFEGLDRNIELYKGDNPYQLRFRKSRAGLGLVYGLDLSVDEHRKRKRALERSRLADPVKHAKEKLRKRTARLKKQIEAWQIDAEYICRGRDLPPSQWIEIFTRPMSANEQDAWIDFAYFLRHRGVHLDQICSMMSCSLEDLNERLATRK